MTWYRGCKGVIPHRVANGAWGGVEEGREGGVGGVVSARHLEEGKEGGAAECGQGGSLKEDVG